VQGAQNLLAHLVDIEHKDGFFSFPLYFYPTRTGICRVKSCQTYLITNRYWRGRGFESLQVYLLSLRAIQC